MTKVSLLTTKSETDFHFFILVIYDWELDPVEEGHQALIKTLSKKWWKAIHAKVWFGLVLWHMKFL